MCVGGGEKIQHKEINHADKKASVCVCAAIAQQSNENERKEGKRMK
jgi:hypothetical protein